MLKVCYLFIVFSSSSLSLVILFPTKGNNIIKIFMS